MVLSHRTLLELAASASVLVVSLGAACGGSSSWTNIDAGDPSDASIDVAPPPTGHSISGTVLGLRGRGLVLKNNGVDAVTLEPGTSDSIGFTFPTKIASGARFEVTVGTQPALPAQVCDVSGASGAVAGDVTSVVVNCSSNTFTVGGTVSGLVGTGLSLKNNNGSELVVNASAFAFPEKFEGGESYAVTVAANPTSPWQTCSLDATASGKVLDANVTNVAVACTTNTYSVKGVVKGLRGAGLVIRNLNEDLPVTANAGADVPFTFPTKLSSGASFVVTIPAQPNAPTQVCEVANSSGNVAGADVDLSIKCTTTRFTIGGKVTGHTGQVVLQNNGGDDLPVGGAGADAAFTFSTTVASGQPYSVTAFKSPPGQVCKVTNGSGNVSTAPVNDVLVACGSAIFVAAPSNGPQLLKFDDTGAAVMPTPFAVGIPYLGMRRGCWDPDGNLYIPGGNNQVGNTVVKVAPTGTVSTFYGGVAIDTPMGCVFDDQGRMYVTSFWRDRVVRISADGKTTEDFITTEHNPCGITRDAQGNIYFVTKVINGSPFEGGAHAYKSDGTPLTTWGDKGSVAGLAGPVDLVGDEAGDIYVAELNRVSRISAGATSASVFIPYVAVADGIVRDSNGNFYVLTLNASARVAKFDASGATLNLDFITGVGSGALNMR